MQVYALFVQQLFDKLFVSSPLLLDLAALTAVSSLLACCCIHTQTLK